MSTNARKFRLALTTLTLVALMLSVFGAVPVWAADTWTVDASFPDNAGCNTTTLQCKDIQAAIDAATAGDTINVVDGTYTITSKILVDEEVTITGNIGNPENVVVQYSPAANSLMFDIRANNVTIEGIKTTGGKSGFWFDQSGVTGCTISHCIVDNVSEYGIYMKNGGSGHTISDNVISNTGQTYAGAPAVLVENCLDVTVSGNTLSSISDKGIYVRVCNAANAAERVEVTGNTLSGCAYSCIQVYQSPYTYVYSNTISSTSDKGINIIGPNASSQTARVIVEGNNISGCPWGGILLTHDRYTYIYNNTISSTGDKGISIANGENVTSSAERIIVEGNNVSGIKYPGIQVAYAVSYTYIHDNTLSGCNYYGADGSGDWDYASIHVDENCGYTVVDSNDVSDGINGIQIWSDNCTVTNNVVYDMGNTYAVTKTTADGTYYNSGIIVGSNWLTNNFKPTGTTITGNSIHDNYYGLYVRDYANQSPGDPITLNVTAEENYWGAASGPGPVGPGSGDNVSTSVDYSPWLGATPGTSPMTWGTDDSIQDAIDAASAGDTVNVADGTYAATTSNSTERPGYPGEWWFVTIDKSLNLVGESRDGVILDGTGLQGEARCTGIWVSASNVTVKNLTIQNFTQTPVTNACYALYVMEKFRDYTWGNVATLDSVTAENVRATDNMYAFYFMKTEHATIKDCISEDNLGDGVWVAWGCDYATVQGNTVTNAGDHGIWVGASWMGPPGSNNATITGNTVNGAREGGISFVASDGATISGNTITNVAGEGWSKGALSLKDSPSNVEAYNNTIYDNDGSWGGYGGTGHGIGIDGTPSNINLHHNNIYGNTGDGCNNSSTVTVTAENNWWGDASGPGGQGPGTGDDVSTYVDYDPWLTGVATGTLQAVIDSAAPGDVIYLGPYTYEGGITINKSITLQGQDGTVIGPGSHGTTVSANDVTLDGITYDGTGCSAGNDGIHVNDGIQNLWIRNCEVKYWCDNGVEFAGAITGLKIVDNYIHHNTDDGIEFNATPGGTVQIYGNAFRSNTVYGINNGGASSVTAEYNEWGDIGGPTTGSGDGVNGSVDYTPWVFGKLYVDPASQNVRETEQATVYVKMDVHHLYGIQFDMTFDHTLLQLNAEPTIGAFNTGTTGSSCTVTDKATANSSGTISFNCNRADTDAEYDATDDSILTLVFDAQDISGTDATSAIDIDASSVVLGAKGGVNIFVDSVTNGEVKVLGTSTVSGVVDLQGRDDDSGAVVDPQAGTTYHSDPAAYTTAAWGTYSFSDMTDDQYIFTVEMPRYLDASRTVTVQGETLDLGTVVLLGGDCDDSDTINIHDATIIGDAFGSSTTSGTGWDARADINDSGNVNILDAVLLGGNWHKSSIVDVPWPAP